MSKYGVLLAGAMRTHQQSHADVFAAHPKCELVAVASEKGDPEGRAAQYQELADNLGLPHIADLDEALARADVHIVSSTPAVERRGIVAAKAMDAGKHVYLDKPLAGTVADLDMIVAAAERNGVVTQMFTQNLAGWVQDAKRAVQGGEIGELLAIHAENIFAKGRAGSVPKGTVRRESEDLGRYTYLEAKRGDVRREHLQSRLRPRGHGRAGLRVGAGSHGELLLRRAPGRGRRGFRGDDGDAGGRRDGDGPGRPVRVDEPSSQRPPEDSRGGYGGDDDLRPIRSPDRIVQQRAGLRGASGGPPRPDGHVGGVASRVQPRAEAQGGCRWGSSDVMADDVAAFVEAIDSGAQPDMNARAAASLSEVILGGFISAARGGEVSLPLPAGLRRPHR